AFARDSGGAQPPAARAARRACSSARDRYETGAPASDCASRYSIHARTASGLAKRRRPTRNVFKWPAAMAAWITGGDSPVTFSICLRPSFSGSNFSAWAVTCLPPSFRVIDAKRRLGALYRPLGGEMATKFAAHLARFAARRCRL